MRMLLPLLIACAVIPVVAPLEAQQARAISPGMTDEDVRAVFGAPAVVRHGDGWTYFFYTNRCLPRCGTDDTVFFEDGRVVAAVLHSPSRRFDGPPAADALPAPAPRAPRVGPAGGAPARISGIRVRTPDGQPDHVTNLGVISGTAQAPTGPQPTPEAEFSLEPVHRPAGAAPQQSTGAGASPQ
jgi:hypothetical protein